MSVLEYIGYQNPEENYFSQTNTFRFVSFVKKYAGPELFREWDSNPSIYICGGFIRAYFEQTEPNDVDLYFKDEQTFRSFVDKFDNLEDYEVVMETERAVTIVGISRPITIQAIRFVFGEIEEVLREFDFTIVKCGADKDRMVLHDFTLDDIDNKTLTYCGSRLPLSSLRRAFKYVKRGYRLRANQIIAIVIDIQVKVDLDNIDQVLYHIESFDPSALGEGVE